MTNLPRVRVLDEFLNFMAVRSHYNAGSDASLAEYIHDWLWGDRGTFDCYGDFEIFLKVIPLIVDEWHRDPTILNFAGDSEHEPFERRVTSAFGDDDKFHDIFDRDNFTAAFFHWQQQEEARRG